MAIADDIAKCQAALIKLVTGKLAVEVDLGDYKAKFQPTEEAALRRLIAELQAQQAGAPTRGAIGFIL